jgi:hypothetical protein
MKDCKSTSGNTSMKSIDIKDLEKQTCLNILIVKGIIYRSYKNKRLGKKGIKLLK